MSYPGFGSGFAQAFGQQVGGLPALLEAIQQRKAQRELLQAQVKHMDTEDKLNQSKLDFMVKSRELYAPIIQQVLGKSGLMGGSPGVQPADSSGGLKDAVVGSDEMSSGNQVPMSLPTGQVGVQPGAVPVSQTQTSGQSEPQEQFDLQQISMDPETGLPKFQIGPRSWVGKIDNVQVSPGIYKRQYVLMDPKRPGAVKTVDLPGQPMPGAEIQATQNAARAMGAPPWAIDHISGLIGIANGLPAEQKAEHLAQIEAEAKHLASQGEGASGDIVSPPDGTAQATPVGGGASAGAPTIAGSMAAADARKVKQVADQATAKQLAENSSKPLPEGQAQKYNSLTAVSRVSDDVANLYKPEYVGKGFQSWISQGLKPGIVDAEKNGLRGGGIGGALREFSGNIAPEEVQFRKGVQDVFNQMLSARNGQRITEQEYNRLKAAMFDVLDQPTVFKPAFDRFRTELNAELQTIKDTATTPASKLGKGPKAISAPTGFSVESITPVSQ